MLNITFAQKMLLRKYRIPISDDLDTLLEAIDDRMSEIGYTDEVDEDGYEKMNKVGEKLDRLYDELVWGNLPEHEHPRCPPLPKN